MKALLAYFARRDRPELTVLLGGLILAMLAFGTFELVGEVLEGDTQAFDERVLRSLRRARDSRPREDEYIVGPR